MEIARNFIDLFLHLDRHLNGAIQDYGVWTYLILFLIIFCETGLVVTPILPGDSLLFTAGALAATAGSPLHVGWLFTLLSVAAVAGDTVNYWIGHLFGDKLAEKYPRVLKKEYLDKTHAFYERYGGETIIIARFVPIVRTFAPFVAGLGRMTYLKFISYNVIGGVFWIALFIFGGYLFGNMPVVQNNFGLVILVIIVLSILPGVIEYLRQRRKAAIGAGMKKCFKGCLLVIGLLLLLILSCSVYVHHPHFRKLPPSSIEVLLYDPSLPGMAHLTNITERASCEAILGALRRGTFSGFGAKADGVLNIRYDSGTTDPVGFTRSYHGDCSFFHHGFYSISSNEFFGVLKGAGVDVLKPPGG